MRVSFVKRGQSLFLLSFVALIAAGTLMLLLPGVLRAGRLSFPDALFVATSAVCVTGLTTVKLSAFTWFGQLLVVLMIQIGGIGIMTLSASILLALGRGLSFSNTLLISNINDKFSLRGTEGLTRTVIRYTLISEGIGVLIIYAGMVWRDPGAWHSGVWHAVFISISSFCNAGFAPFDDSLGGMNRLVQLSSSGLNILGGLGVYVIYDLIEVAKKRQAHLRIHSKVVLLTTGILLIGGTLLFWLCGRKCGAPLALGDAFFLASSARTAGFVTFDITGLPAVSLTLAIVLMMIGGSPGSTAGGMKTSTAAVAVAAILNTLQGNNEVLMFKRKIPTANVLRAFTIIVLFLLICSAGASLLQLMTPGASMMDAFFETASALSTTGLSISNTTAKLADAGKFFVSFLMFLGRMGPFTIMLFLLGREKPGQLRYPAERVIIG